MDNKDTKFCEIYIFLATKKEKTFKTAQVCISFYIFKSSQAIHMQPYIKRHLNGKIILKELGNINFIENKVKYYYLKFIRILVAFGINN